MSRIVWDTLGERLYEIGLDHGVVYFPSLGEFRNGVAWNGLTDVSTSNDGRESSVLYKGDLKGGELYTLDEPGGSIKAYTYPDEFEKCFGDNEVQEGVVLPYQSRTDFGLCYRTLIGSDIAGNDKGYKLHLLYNLQISEFDRSYATISDSVDIEPMEWKYTQIPMEVDGYEPITEIVLDSTRIKKSRLTQIENILYGSILEDPRLPDPDEIFDLYLDEEDEDEDDEPDPVVPLNELIKFTDYIITADLPRRGNPNTIYFIPSDGASPHAFSEYVYLNNKWEQLGTNVVLNKGVLYSNGLSVFGLSQGGANNQWEQYGTKHVLSKGVLYTNASSVFASSIGG